MGCAFCSALQSCSGTSRCSRKTRARRPVHLQVPRGPVCLPSLRGTVRRSIDLAIARLTRADCSLVYGDFQLPGVPRTPSELISAQEAL